MDINTMTEQQAGNFYLDACDVEGARLILARATGVPEHVLYDDPSPELYSKDDAPLNMVIDLQERMSKGMALIHECNDKLEYFKNGHWVPRDVFMGWVNRRKHLWTHWFELKAQCDMLAKEQVALWAEYFKLVEEDITPYYTTSDPTDIDEQTALYEKGGTVRVYRDTHLVEEAKAV